MGVEGNRYTREGPTDNPVSVVGRVDEVFQVSWQVGLEHRLCTSLSFLHPLLAVENFILAPVIIIPLLNFGRTGPMPHLSVISST